MRLRQTYIVPPGLAATAAVIGVVLLFSGLVQYRFDSGLSSVAPTVFIVPFLALGCVCAAFGGLFGDRMGRALLCWAGAYLVISGLGTILAPDPETSAIILRQRLLAVAFLLAFRALCSTSQACRWAIRAVCAVQLASIAFNVYEWYAPLSFSTTYGRAAGLYVNPNIAGEALVAGMIIGVLALSRAWRGAFVAGSALGVLLTVSRGAALGGGLAVLSLIRGQTARRRRMWLGMLAAMVVVWGATQLNWTNSELSDTQPELFDRLTYSGSRDDANTDSRLELAQAGLRMFLASPISGRGLGATDWQQGNGTHNIYLMHLAEHGFLGIVIFPWLLTLLAVRAWSMKRHPEFLGLALFLATWGFFSHNILDEFQTLVILAIALAPAEALGAALTQDSPVRSPRPSPIARLAPASMAVTCE